MSTIWLKERSTRHAMKYTRQGLTDMAHSLMRCLATLEQDRISMVFRHPEIHMKNLPTYHGMVQANLERNMQ